MVLKKSVLVLLAAIVGLTWVQAFPEHRGEFQSPRPFSDSTTQDDNDVESHRIAAPRTPRVYVSNDVATAALTEDGLSEATPTRKYKVRLSERAALKLIHDVYETSDEIKSIWESQSTSERSRLLNMRQTLCNVVTNVYMPLDDKIIQDIQNAVCLPFLLNSEEEMSL